MSVIQIEVREEVHDDTDSIPQDLAAELENINAFAVARHRQYEQHLAETARLQKQLDDLLFSADRFNWDKRLPLQKQIDDVYYNYRYTQLAELQKKYQHPTIVWTGHTLNTFVDVDASIQAAKKQYAEQQRLALLTPEEERAARRARGAYQYKPAPMSEAEWDNLGGAGQEYYVLSARGMNTD